MGMGTHSFERCAHFFAFPTIARMVSFDNPNRTHNMELVSPSAYNLRILAFSTSVNGAWWKAFIEPSAQGLATLAGRIFGILLVSTFLAVRNGLHHHRQYQTRYRTVGKCYSPSEAKAFDHRNIQGKQSVRCSFPRPPDSYLNALLNPALLGTWPTFRPERLRLSLTRTFGTEPTFFVEGPFTLRAASRRACAFDAAGLL